MIVVECLVILLSRVAVGGIYAPPQVVGPCDGRMVIVVGR